MPLGRARDRGQAAVLEPRSRRPKTSPSRIGDEIKPEAVQVRAALESLGLDHGPICVHDKMKAMGLAVPSIALLARIFIAVHPWPPKDVDSDSNGVPRGRLRKPRPVTEVLRQDASPKS